jgi:hypothetical protein
VEIGNTAQIVAQRGHIIQMVDPVTLMLRVLLQPLLRLALYRSQFLTVEVHTPTHLLAQLVTFKFWLLVVVLPGVIATALLLEAVVVVALFMSRVQPYLVFTQSKSEAAG